jgi:uncharacterized protein (TIGR00730 family)
VPPLARVAVYCGSSFGARPSYADAARRFGTALAGRDIGLVYGGASVGLMGALADAVAAAGGEVVGVIPQHLVDDELAHPGLPQLEIVQSMHERKARMADLASGFVALPGGFGTLDETIELLTWNQLGLIAKPVVFLDVNGFFDPLFAFFAAAVDAGFVRPAHLDLARRAGSVDEAIELATAPVPASPPKWLDRDRA